MPKKPTITARLCETKPAKRIKVYDDKCPGFFVSVTPRGVATFYFKYWDRVLNKQVPVRIGDYDPVHLTVDDARAQAYDLKGRAGKGEDIAGKARTERAQQAKLRGKTVAEIIDEYEDWMKEPVKKPDGEMRPRIESWKGAVGYLNRFARPALGTKVASEVTNDDIANLQARITKGFGAQYKPSVSSARLTRSALSGMFGWAAEAGRRYVTASPCVNLPSLDKEPARKRVLTPEEIRTLWLGLDRPDLPYSRKVALALKFELVTMLRTKEFLTSRPGEFTGLGTADATFNIPLKRVKKRHGIIHPLSDLAQEIVAELIADGGEHLFFDDGAYLDDKALSKAVRGYKPGGDLPDRQGILEFLGMKKWTPHDLRRTAATLAGDLGFTDAEIARCLDHRKDRGEDTAPTVTGAVYVQSKRTKEKRKVLDAVAKALREIIGTKPPSAERPDLRLVKAAA